MIEVGVRSRIAFNQPLVKVAGVGHGVLPHQRTYNIVSLGDDQGVIALSINGLRLAKLTQNIHVRADTILPNPIAGERRAVRVAATSPCSNGRTRAVLLVPPRLCIEALRDGRNVVWKRVVREAVP